MSKTKETEHDLRANLLGMALGIAESQARCAFQNEHLKPPEARALVRPYTTEDVIVEAEKLYQFVRKK